MQEFEQLISHEVVRGHVTTFAYLRNRYAQKQVDFETTVLTMNTRAVTLFEGIANNAILIAHGVTEVGVLPYEYLQIGVLLALLLDDAKNQSSYLTWKEKAAQREVARIPRQGFLVTRETSRQIVWSLGKASAIGANVSACLSFRDRPGSRTAAAPQSGENSSGIVRCNGLVNIESMESAIGKTS